MKTFIVDSFTREPFRGNPAGVCLHRGDVADETMQLVAFELGLSETAFVDVGPGHGGGPDGPATDASRPESVRPIRYFSPKQEIPLCGHATLAAAEVMRDVFGEEQMRFRTGEGIDLAVQVDGDRLAMDLPRYDTTPAVASPKLLAALGIGSVVDAGYNEDLRILLLEIADTAVLAALTPDFTALRAAHDSIAGVLVTARADSDDSDDSDDFDEADDFDFHSRYFWPWSGTNEDPVTGGTHTFLAPWWSAKIGRTRLRSFQASERSGSMEVEVHSGGVRIFANAVIVLEGNLRGAGAAHAAGEDESSGGGRP